MSKPKVDILLTSPNIRDKSEVFAPASEEPLEVPDQKTPGFSVVKTEEHHLPPAMSDISARAKAMGVRFVSVEHEYDGALVTLAGKSVEDLQSPGARKLVYDARHHYGMSNSGIEIFGGTSRSVDGEYHQTYKLNRGN